MVYPIVLYGDPVLETPAAKVTAFDGELKTLIDDMFESMYAAHGVGLAAPQIGIGKQITVIDVTFKEDPEQKLVLINPEIIATEGKQRGQEGCLSLPEFREDVSRANLVTVRRRTSMESGLRPPAKACLPAHSCMRSNISKACCTFRISAA